MFHSGALLLIAAIGLSGAAHGQDWQESLKRIQAAADPYCDKTVSEACKTIEYVERLALGLRGGWAISEEQRKKPLPKEYVENLKALATQIETVVHSAEKEGGSPKNLVDGFAFLADDLSAKVDDCLQFGMGRLITVNLRTVRSDSTVDPGWEVFYKCILSTGQAGGELQAPGITTTVALIPPSAICTFRAQKGGQQILTGQIPVFGREPFPVDIKVP